MSSSSPVPPIAGSTYSPPISKDKHGAAAYYDAVGNLGHWRQGATACPTSGAGYYTYSYDTGWNLLSGLNYNGMTFAYNTAGSLTCKSEGTTTTRYTHDFLQQLTKVEVGVPADCVTGAGTSMYNYWYDGIGRRIKTSDGTTTSLFMYSGSRMLYSKVGNAETAYVYVADRLILRKVAGLQPSYYHEDISPGSVRLITNYTSSIQVEAKYRYRPFGDLIILSGTSQRFQYAQQEYDGSAIRQYHMGLRYEDPIVGRFVQRDPIGPGYSYASNNPISYWDPTGTTTWWGNFHNWLSSPPGRMTVTVVSAAVSVALAVPSGGTSLADLAFTASVGVLVGTIFVVAAYAFSGGKASTEDYIDAFAFGFTIGAVIGGSLCTKFRLAEPKLGAAKTADPAGGLNPKDSALGRGPRDPVANRLTGRRGNSGPRRK